MRHDLSIVVVSVALSTACALERLEVSDEKADRHRALVVASFADSSDVWVFDAQSNSFVSSFTESSPRGMAPDPIHGGLFIAQRSSDSVAIFDSAEVGVVDSIRTCPKPTELALSPDGARLYVGCDGDSSVDVVETTTGTRVALLLLPMRARSLAVSPDGEELWVGGACGETCAMVFSASDYHVLAQADGVGPVAITFAPDGTFAYAANPIGCDGRFERVNPVARTAVKEIFDDGTGEARAVAIAPDGQRAFFGKRGCGANDTIYAASTADESELARVTAPNAAHALAVTADGTALWIARTDEVGGHVSVVDLQTLRIASDFPAGRGNPWIAVTR